MKSLLYVGNKLSQHGLNQTTMETLGPLLEREGFALTYTSSLKNPYLRMVAMLWRVFLSRKSDYVLMDTYSTFSFWYAFTTSQLCRLLGVKYIPFLHGGNLPNRLRKNPKMCRMIFNHAYKNVAPSPYLYAEFQKEGFDNLIYIPNVIEIGNYPFLERKKASPKLLWVRAFASIYNPKMAVDVLFELQKTYPDATLCMVGPDKDGSLETTKEYAEKLGVAVRFTGRLSKEEWTTLSQKYDIFINTTHFDNTPISVIEAIGLGLAVVSTDVGGIPFLLTHSQDALLVPDGSTTEMVSAIKSLITHSDLFQELTSKARYKVESFDWNVIKHKWVEIFQ